MAWKWNDVRNSIDRIKRTMWSKAVVAVLWEIMLCVYFVFISVIWNCFSKESLAVDIFWSVQIFLKRCLNTYIYYVMD
jgi:hypothetical protein